MKITSNYVVNNSSNGTSKCGKPAFGAAVPADITNLLVSAAKSSKDTNAVQKLAAQLANVCGWGTKGSKLERSFDIVTMTDSFCLSNPSISKYYSGDLGVNPNDSSLKQFLSLTEEKVLKAEAELKGVVKDNRTKAMAMLKEKYPNMPQDKLEAAVNNMSESEIMNLRFPVKEEVMSDNLINFVI